jgi:hypothetical protein
MDMRDVSGVRVDATQETYLRSDHQAPKRIFVIASIHAVHGSSRGRDWRSRLISAISDLLKMRTTTSAEGRDAGAPGVS